MISTFEQGGQDKKRYMKKTKRGAENKIPGERGRLDCTLDVLPTEILKFLDNNLDPLTVAALQTVSKRYRDYLQTTLVAAKKIHELKSRYRTKFDGCEDCFFVEAASDGQIEDVQTFLTQTKIDVNQVDDEGHTALYEASRKGHCYLVSLLLAHPNINVNQEDEVGNTPLHMAVTNGHTKVVQSLLKHSFIEVNRQDLLLRTPLHKAANNGHVGIVKEILKHPRIQVNLESNGGTPLNFASAKGHNDIVDLLRSKGGIMAERTSSSEEEEESDGEYLPFA